MTTRQHHIPLRHTIFDKKRPLHNKPHINPLKHEEKTKNIIHAKQQVRSNLAVALRVLKVHLIPIRGRDGDENSLYDGHRIWTNKTITGSDLSFICMPSRRLVLVALYPKTLSNRLGHGTLQGRVKLHLVKCGGAGSPEKLYHKRPKISSHIASERWLRRRALRWVVRGAEQVPVTPFALGFPIGHRFTIRGTTHIGT